MTSEALFARFVMGLFVLLFLYGCGMMITIIWVDQGTGVKMLNGFATMFSGILGFGSGFLLGRTKQEAGS